MITIHMRMNQRLTCLGTMKFHARFCIQNPFISQIQSNPIGSSLNRRTNASILYHLLVYYQACSPPLVTSIVLAMTSNFANPFC
ncbi:hypothetical protein QL285_062532 [Trifolium repens]|nr:hypothetical protein QL285_062532 [Trifolium repens]